MIVAKWFDLDTIHHQNEYETIHDAMEDALKRDTEEGTVTYEISDRSSQYDRYDIIDYWEKNLGLEPLF